MRLVKWTLASVLALLSACVVAPIGPPPRAYVGARVVVAPVVVRPYYYRPYYRPYY